MKFRFVSVFIIFCVLFALTGCEKGTEGEAYSVDTRSTEVAPDETIETIDDNIYLESSTTDQTDTYDEDSVSESTNTNDAFYSDIDWNADLFTKGSTIFNIDLAILCARMSQKCYDIDNLFSMLVEWDFLDGWTFNYTEDDTLGIYIGENCFSVSHSTMEINGKKTTVICIVCKGTGTLGEILGDWLKGHPYDKTQDFFGVDVWTNIYDYYSDVMYGLEIYVENHEDILLSDDIKFVITGHSLGGAAANLVGADITSGIGYNEWWSDLVTKSDVYVYTFGAIKTLKDTSNYSYTFENIHNIYNYYDSFGPHGNYSATNASSPYSKFGHTDIYKDDRCHFEEYGFSFENHDLKNYLFALSLEKASGGVLDYECTEVDDEYEEAPIYNDYQDMESMLVPEGTYVSYYYGIVANVFTFYGDHRVSMNALGIVGDGTYVISDDEITITYSTNISDKECVWRMPFSYYGDTLYIGEDEFVKQ